VSPVHADLPVIAIDGIAAGGEGVGRLPDGRAVFVHRTAPGDEAAIRITSSKPRYARGELVSLRTASPQRREAPCRHYDRCGGCTLEHMTPDAQRAARSELVVAALGRIGGVAVERPVVAAAPEEFRYRNRATFTLIRTPRGPVAGFHERGRPGRVLDLGGECLLLEPALANVWNALRAGWGEHAALLPAGPRLRLTLRVSEAGGATLLIDGGAGRGQPDVLLAAVPELHSIWRRRGPGTPVRLAAGEPVLHEVWDGEAVALRGDVFLQVNRAAAALLERHVLSTAGNVAGLHVVDAYCGIGLHARRLARAGARVTGIELDSNAVAEARRSLPDGRFLIGRVEELLASVLPADIVITNPPRAGMDAAASAALRERPPRRLIYVSCDPATLARDVARLAPALTPASLRCFDLFPQTAHVETVLEMTCGTS
jgi:23S rRNA (uracil1939-C5)-methyltransferase